MSSVTDTLNYKNQVFDNPEPLIITLRYDISSFVKLKAKSEEQYFPAELVIHFSDSDSVKKNIRIKARGNFRKQHCFFPPIHLNFKTDKIKADGFEEVNKIKVVTHCKISKNYEQYILKEYLSYRIYNHLTDNSLKVRLLRINYEDTGKRKQHYQKYGFIIEPTKMLAQRINCIEVDRAGFKPSDFLRKDLDQIALFHYMIGNTDWKLSAGHNLKFFKAKDAFITQLNVVPYDFDYSGLVNAAYAIPQEWSDAKTTIERDYLGYCWEDTKEMESLLQLFKANEAAIINEIRNLSDLDTREREAAEAYIISFYDEVKKTRPFLQMIQKSCLPID